MTDWRKQFEVKEFDRSAQPAKVCFSWASLESFVAEVKASERAAVIAEIEGWLVDEEYPITDPDSIDYGMIVPSPKNDWNDELRAKLVEMKEEK